MNYLKKVVKYLVKPWKIVIFANVHGFHRLISDKFCIRCLYRDRMGGRLNLKNPRTFNEKLQWLKLYDRKPEYTMMVDKYRVREYIGKTIGEQYLIPLLGIWEDPEAIDFDALPEQFVLKCNHNSGLGMCICKDKPKLDVAKVKQALNQGLKQNYYISGREWPYKDVPRCILAEKYMADESGTELKDYKVMCFGGEPKLIQVHQGRFSQHVQDFYDTNWNWLDVTQGAPRSVTPMARPSFLDEMLEQSKRLSDGIRQVRVDWYFVENQLYFGELTFFDASGFDAFEPDEWDKTLGDWIKLPAQK